MRAYKLCEVPKSTLKDKVKNKEKNIEKISQYSSCRKPVLDEVTGEWRRLHNEELNDLY